MTNSPFKYEEKEGDYYSNVRQDLLTLLPKNSQNLKVLEIGAGYGATLSFLKKQGIASEVVGVDIPENEGTLGFDNIDEFFYADAEKLDLSNYKGHFDYIILADVLEHLVHPDEVLQSMKELLNKDGKILVSMPNFRTKQAFYKVFIKGDFSYEESGLFDYTHLRFFCKKNIRTLIEDNGYEVESMISSLKAYKGKSLSKIVNLLTFRIFEEFFSVQYLVRAKPKT
jgi:2-polyprenyl-3-methyl-5-hydroxy-6-metoxy-1,4-benzoquinol methylase